MKIQHLLSLIFVVCLSCRTIKPDKEISCTYHGDDVSVLPISGSTLAIEANKKYTFSLIGLNNAYYGVDYNIIKTKKNISLNSVLAPYIPQSQTPISPAGRQSFNRSFETVSLPSFTDTIFEDYNRLNNLYEMIDASSKILDQNKNDWAKCKTSADSLIESASRKLKMSPSNVDPNALENQIDLTISDFKIRLQLLKDNGKIQADFTGVKLYQEGDFVEKHEKDMRAYVDLLAANQKANDTIKSKAYNVNKGDYLDVAFTIYGHRFAEQKDTLLTQTLRFYRIHYVSLDVSAGVFGTNLLSQSYYFTDALGHYTSESSKKGNLSIGALVQCNYVINPGLKAGPCTGAAISVMDGKPQIFVGGNLVIGRSTEFVLSGGWAYSYLPVPSNVVKSGYVSTIEGAVPTYNKFMTGFFIGVSYNIIQK